MRSIKLNMYTLRHALLLLCLGLLLSGCGGGHGNLDTGVRDQAQGKYRAAYIQAKKVLQKDKKNGAAWLLLGKASMMLGNPKDALNALENARANGVPKSQWAVPTARVLGVTQQHHKLLENVSADKLADPETKARVDVLRGDAHLGLQQRDEAKKSYQAALALNANDPRALVGLAKLAATADNLDAANTYLQKALTAAPKNPQAWVLKGDLALNNQDLASAEADYQKVLGFKKPDWLPQERFYAMTRLANAQTQQSQFDKALSSIQTLEKMSPQQPYPHYLHAVVLYRQGHLDDAVSQLQQVLKAQPDNAQAQFLMGAVNYAQGNYSQTEMHLSNVMGTDRNNVPARKLLALTLYRQGRSQQAVDTLRPAVPGKPSDDQLRTLLQHAAANGPDTSGAVATAHSTGKPAGTAPATSTGAQPDTGFAQAGKAFASGNTAQAIQLLKQIPAGDASTEARRNILLVMTYVRENHPEKAVKTAAAYAARNPDKGTAHLLYGTALVAAGKRDAARAQYSRARKLDPKSVVALLNLGGMDLQEGHYKDAAARYQTALQHDPHNAVAITALGRVAMLRGDKTQAIKRFKQAIDAAPKSASAYVGLVTLYSKDGQFDKAVSTAKQLVKAAPHNPAALNALGAAELDAGHHGKASRPLHQAVKLAPKVPLYRTNLARAQILNKDTQDARNNLNQVIKADPGQVPAVKLLAFMKLQDHDLPGALSLAQTLKKHTATKAAGLSLEGDLYMASKSYDKAAHAYQQGLQIKDQRSLVIKSFQALSAGGATHPQGVLSDWLSKHPDDAAIRLLLGQYDIGQNQNTQAASQYEKVLKAYPSNINALNNLAWIYAEQHNPKALALAKKAHELAPKSPDVADTYGWALIADNQPGSALPILEKAAKAAPKVSSIQYHLAVAQARTGDKAGARATLEALHKSDAKFQDQQAAEKLYRQLGGAGE